MELPLLNDEAYAIILCPLYYCHCICVSGLWESFYSPKIQARFHLRVFTNDSSTFHLSGFFLCFESHYKSHLFWEAFSDYLATAEALCFLSALSLLPEAPTVSVCWLIGYLFYFPLLVWGQRSCLLFPHFIPIAKPTTWLILINMCRMNEWTKVWSYELKLPETDLAGLSQNWWSRPPHWYSRKPELIF